MQRLLFIFFISILFNGLNCFSKQISRESVPGFSKPQGVQNYSTDKNLLHDKSISISDVTDNTSTTGISFDHEAILLIAVSLEILILVLVFIKLGLLYLKSNEPYISQQELSPFKFS